MSGKEGGEKRINEKKGACWSLEAMGTRRPVVPFTSYGNVKGIIGHAWPSESKRLLDLPKVCALPEIGISWQEESLRRSWREHARRRDANI